METTPTFSADDIAYIKEHYIHLEPVPSHLPAPSYVLDDGSGYYPRDYFMLEMNEARFKMRLGAQAIIEGVEPLDLDETWQTYLSGIYGVCLWSATPENIVRKAALVERIEALIAAPNERSSDWIAALRSAVDALDALERPFSPHYDRVRFGRAPTRDSHIRDVRRRFPQIR